MKTYNPNIIGQRLLSNGQYQCDCPFCGKKEHFYFSSTTGLWDCKKCGETGNYFAYVKRLKIFVKEERKKKKITSKLDETLKVDNRLEIKEEAEEVFSFDVIPTIELPNEFKKLKCNSKNKFYNYIYNRRYSKEQIKELNLYYCDTPGYFWNRLIIPVYIRKELKGYLGRWIPIKGINDKKVKRKYRNSYGTDFSKMLWNYDKINNRFPVIICEGVLSAKRIGFNSVASFGKKLSKFQIWLLEQKKVKEVVVLFDSGAEKEIAKISDLLISETKIKVRTYLLDEGDPDDLNNSDGKLYEKIVTGSDRYYSTKIVSVIQSNNFGNLLVSNVSHKKRFVYKVGKLKGLVHPKQ